MIKKKKLLNRQELRTLTQRYFSKNEFMPNNSHSLVRVIYTKKESGMVQLFFQILNNDEADPLCTVFLSNKSLQNTVFCKLKNITGRYFIVSFQRSRYGFLEINNATPLPNKKRCL